MSEQLGRDIARARAKARLSGAQLAARAGVTPSWVRQVESGRVKKPAPAKLAAIARELGLPVEPMLAMTDQLGVTLETPPSDAGAGNLAAAFSGLSAWLQAYVEQTDARLAAAERRAQALEDIVASLVGPGRPEGAPRDPVPELARAWGEAERPSTSSPRPADTPSGQPAG